MGTREEARAAGESEGEFMLYLATRGSIDLPRTVSRSLLIIKDFYYSVRSYSSPSPSDSPSSLILAVLLGCFDYSALISLRISRFSLAYALLVCESLLQTVAC